ncbi:MAG: hypothetical protein KatS3mg102_0547 [Planctomycetota bacterium]|nr:MAG: hypothetical protein KatS3mg102_0547 [Planctomycetota bacterium]
MAQAGSSTGGSGGSMTLVGRVEGTVIQQSRATVQIEAPAPPTGGESEPWQYVAIVRVPAYELTHRAEGALLVQGKADQQQGLCQQCQADKQKTKQELDARLGELAEAQRRLAELEGRIPGLEAAQREAEARVLPRIDDMWRDLQQLARRSFTFLRTALTVMFDLLDGGGVSSENRKRAEEDLAAVNRAKARVEQSIHQIEQVRQHCTHLEPTLQGAAGELRNILQIIKSFKLDNLQAKGRELKQAVEGASNVRAAVGMLDGKPCQRCLEQARQALEAAKQELEQCRQQVEQLQKQVEELQKKYDSFPETCEHQGGGAGQTGNGPAQGGGGAGQAASGPAQAGGGAAQGH